MNTITIRCYTLQKKRNQTHPVREAMRKRQVMRHERHGMQPKRQGMRLMAHDTRLTLAIDDTPAF